MAIRTKILVVDSDLENLSRIYLALIHRNYKAEASNNCEEIEERLKRLKPALIILALQEFLSLRERLRIPVILILEKGTSPPHPLPEEIVAMEKPVHLEKLLCQIKEMVY